MYGYYKNLTNQSTAAFTGKGLSFGGSLMRPEATGYGCVYFTANAAKRGLGFNGCRVAVSGSSFNSAVHGGSQV